jgi:magnesium-transporting ATPase (P-type)
MLLLCVVRHTCINNIFIIISEELSITFALFLARWLTRVGMLWQQERVKDEFKGAAGEKKEPGPNKDENGDSKTSIGDHGRQGLTSAEAKVLYDEVGLNELSHVEISSFKLFALQFVGLMPYILEVSCIIAIAVQSYEDFAIILAILFANACLGYHEEIKARKSLVCFQSCF